MGPRAFNRVCASIRINRDYDVVSVRINAHGVTKRAWAFNCETTVYKIRIASWPAVHVCEGSLQVARLSAILLDIFLGNIFSHC